jgi:hypothetical protein
LQERQDIRRGVRKVPLACLIVGHRGPFPEPRNGWEPQVANTQRQIVHEKADMSLKQLLKNILLIGVDFEPVPGRTW